MSTSRGSPQVKLSPSQSARHWSPLVHRIPQSSCSSPQLPLGTRDPQQLKAPLPVRRIDFDEPSTLAGGFEGAEVLLISAGHGEGGTVMARHGAAEKAGVSHVVCTSLSADGDHLPYALPHRWTERRLQDGTMDWTILRNGLYAELLGALAAP
ncbi:NAD(P)H-binding protein [Streptomyces sp. SCSIO 30461]|uniref:SDR family oxidoreductase n=1 Tax=Streptomyces sp. SCSIO 30461 TaxID=3118085 RepID=UPI0030CFB427